MRINLRPNPMIYIPWYKDVVICGIFSQVGLCLLGLYTLDKIYVG